MSTPLAPGNHSATAPPGPALYDAVLLDRDGTLIEDVPYNGDPEKVRPLPGVREALDGLRAAGLRLAVVTNQSGLARGHFTEPQLHAVHARVEELLGPFDHWAVCPHDDTDRCDCRKPAPGLVHAAARALGTTPRRCLMVGDIGRDMAAALAAGATGILVPTAVTRPEEVAEAPAVARDLPGAVHEILRRMRAVQPVVPRTGRAGTVLVVRSDSAGDVLVTGPGIRAVAAGAERVVLLCGPRGRAAAELLPGVDEIIEWRLPWIDGDPEPVDRADIRALTDRLAGVGAAEAVIFTSFHQSPLPLALLLRLAGVPRISAISDDYPGSLLDVRHRVPVGVPEPERALSLAAAAGFALPADDEPGLRLRHELTGPTPGLPAGEYVVVHPGSSVPARACPPRRCAEIVAALAADGHRVVVTGGPGERELTALVAAAGGTDLGGGTDLAGLARILAGARCLVVGNTGPAHLAAAVGTPVVSLFAPTVPFGQWGPYRVPTVRLGDAGAPCRDTRAAVCPVAGHPCLTRVDPADVVAAVRALAPPPPR
ncbi:MULTISPECIES: HAD-IIIA family hydrolase [Micromonospora]|uniref:D,D-heptose 1,7-bisphosphate phosphatase n=1 Tax=Micromonospora solifontis TaxID=2487138 RepID=A0ABX9WNJ4_9ACTN|nr:MULTISPECIES: HAD-IIIA family hydrolase [Micromonospora]NES15556.1 HAD-IIIA family hydrolase [Micromonospora sp. PPF5-17B]NES35222.1 HAD-IIIA family hydrolase [Micromonospora solifontis]NES55217.1 HAD-IIIA family hydrolase [Micromonospora sp. PPF5-6]RNM01198.1 HAD-IIIA family hydrolase [Micromonospora solifontis]